MRGRCIDERASQSKMMASKSPSWSRVHMRTAPLRVETRPEARSPTGPSRSRGQRALEDRLRDSKLASAKLGQVFDCAPATEIDLEIIGGKIGGGSFPSERRAPVARGRFRSRLASRRSIVTASTVLRRRTWQPTSNRLKFSSPELRAGKRSPQSGVPRGDERRAVLGSGNGVLRVAETGQENQTGVDDR